MAVMRVLSGAMRRVVLGLALVALLMTGCYQQIYTDTASEQVLETPR